MKRIIAIAIIFLMVVPAAMFAQGAARVKPAATNKAQTRDEIITEMVDLSASAYQFRRLPAAKGGGGGSYEKFKIGKKGPKGIKILKAAADSIVFKKGDVEAVLDSTGNVNFR